MTDAKETSGIITLFSHWKILRMTMLKISFEPEVFIHRFNIYILANLL